MTTNFFATKASSIDNSMISSSPTSAPTTSVRGDVMNNPFITLIYLVFVFLPLMFMPAVSALAWLASIAAVLIFVPIHFSAWRNGQQYPALHIAAPAAIGLALIPLNLGGNTFIIYSLAMAGALLPSRRAILAGASAWVLMTIEVLLLGHTLPTALAYCGIVLLIGGMALTGAVFGQIQKRQHAELKLSHDEIKRLAAVAERERIARDLHDLLGHTLSVVVLKSELAGKLLDRDINAARVQIHEVEQVARQALSEVRQAVSGIRQSGVLAELAACRLALLSADITLLQTINPLDDIASEVETALALSLREASTNVLRHAEAQRVEVELREEDTDLLLQIRDDGRGGAALFGNGLQGMRERVRALHGQFDIDSPPGGGTCIRIRIPAPWRVEPGARSSSS